MVVMQDGASQVTLRADRAFCPFRSHKSVCWSDRTVTCSQELSVPVPGQSSALAVISGMRVTRVDLVYFAGGKTPGSEWVQKRLQLSGDGWRLPANIHPGLADLYVASTQPLNLRHYTFCFA